MSWTIGIDPHRVDDAALFGLGEYGAESGSEYIYVRTNAAVAQAGEVVVVALNHSAHPVTTATDLIGRQVGVALVPAANGKYIWLLVRGETQILVAANCSSHAHLRATSTAGVLDDSGSGPIVAGMVASEDAGSMQGLVGATVVYPVLQSASGGGGGASDFTDLGDTPSALGTATQIVQVNTGETALEFVDKPTGGGGGVTATTEMIMVSKAGTEVEINPVAAGVVTALHGLGKMPDYVEYYCECLTAEFGYAVGERAEVFQRAFGRFRNETTIGAGWDGTNPLFLSNRISGSEGNRVAATNASWKLVVTPYIFEAKEVVTGIS